MLDHRRCYLHVFIFQRHEDSAADSSKELCIHRDSYHLLPATCRYPSLSSTYPYQRLSHPGGSDILGNVEDGQLQQMHEKSPPRSKEEVMITIPGPSSL